MMIVDAISSASTEHAVHFLVTAYIESLRHFERSMRVPEAVLQLPISGSADLAARLNALKNNIDAPLEAVVPRSEFAGVLACAVARLSELNGETKGEDKSLLRAA
jgi:hypothetical protein